MRSPMPVPVGFGGKEGLEYPFRLFRRKPYSGIAHRNENLLGFSSLRLDDHLANLHAVRDDLRKIVG
jgi:hypothetical protein